MAIDIRLICFQNDDPDFDGAVVKYYEYLSFMVFNINREKIRLCEARISAEFILFEGESRYGYSRILNRSDWSPRSECI